MTAALCAGFTLLPAGAAAASPGGLAVPIDPYPVSAPSPVGDSRPPFFLDEDETVRAQLTPAGQVTSLVDDAILKLRGSGDYVIFLPAKVTQVHDLRGDTPPGLQGGRVSFLGNLVGQSQVGAEATLDLSVAQTMPLRVRLTYMSGGRVIPPSRVAGMSGPVTVQLEATNVTAQAQQFTRGNASAAALASVLDNLRQAGPLYTPETDLQAQLPLPAAINVSPPVTQEGHSVYVPLALTLTARLQPGALVGDAGGADVTSDPRGDRLTWTEHLPAAPGSDTATRDFSFTYSARSARLPALDLRADPLPFPPAVFTPPGGASWAALLAGTADRADYLLLAEEGAASLHRIGELLQPLGRPGPGPVKVKYDFILESGAAPAPAPGPPPVHGQPWAIALAIIAGAFALANAAWAWARH